MRLGTFTNGRSDLDDLFGRFFGAGDPSPAWASTYSVPTDVFHADDRLVIRMDLPGVDPDEVEVTVQENTLLINGKREFPHDANDVRFVRRGVFYGDFTQRVALGKGLDVERIAAAYDNGVLELTIPYREEVQPKKISIDVGGSTKRLTA
jgi:HSP20 family protein